MKDEYDFSNGKRGAVLSKEAEYVPTPAQRMAKRDAICEKIGNAIFSITGIQCPRHVKNPGLYFGAVMGYEAGFAESEKDRMVLQKRVEELERERDENPFYREKKETEGALRLAHENMDAVVKALEPSERTIESILGKIAYLKDFEIAYGSEAVKQANTSAEASPKGSDEGGGAASGKE